MNDAGQIRPLSDAELSKAWATLEAEGANWLAVRRKFNEQQSIGWHHYAAGEAESKKNWFAAEFHLKWLVTHEPADSDVRVRLSRVQSRRAGIPLPITRWNYPKDEAGRAGCFKKVGELEWVELKNEKPFAKFRETARTPDHVELYNPDRKIWVRLDETEARITSDETKTTWELLFTGGPPKDEPPPQTPAPKK